MGKATNSRSFCFGLYISEFIEPQCMDLHNREQSSMGEMGISGGGC